MNLSRFDAGPLTALTAKMETEYALRQILRTMSATGNRVQARPFVAVSISLVCSSAPGDHLLSETSA